MKKLGFTLIELLIVLAIIGIVAAFILPNYEAYVLIIAAAEAKAVLRTLSDACVDFYIESGRWPTEAEGLTVLNIQPPQSRYFIYGYNGARPPLTVVSVITQYKDLGLLKNDSIYEYMIQHYDQPTHFGKIGQAVADGWYRYYFAKKRGLLVYMIGMANA